MNNCFPGAGIGLACAFIAPLHAAPALEDEIVVVGSYTPLRLAESGAATHVIDLEQIRHRAPIVLSDLLRDVPGFAVSRSGTAGSFTQVRVRGAEANQLLVLIDGAEANDAVQGDEFNWGTLAAADVERIEIVRGPQTTFEGSDALAGVVNIVTRSATDPFSLQAWGEGGSFGTRSSGLSAGHAGERFNVRLGVSDTEADGENVSRSGGEEDGFENRSYTLKSAWDVAAKLRLDLAARRSEGEAEFDEVDFSTGLPADSAARSEYRNDTARLQAGYALLDDAWRHTLAYAHSASNNQNFPTLEPGTRASATKDQYRYVSSFAWAAQTQRVSGLLEREDEDFEQRGVAMPWGDPNQDRSRRTDSAGLEYRGTFLEALTLAASARVDDHSEFRDADTWRAEAVYAIADRGTRLRAAWGTAVKVPTFTERFGYFTNFHGNPELRPEESESREVGIDQDLLDGRLALALTLFHADLDDEIDGFVWDPARFGYTAANVDGSSTREGAEVSLDAELSATLQLNASYTYTDATQPDANGNDSEELRRAPHLGSLTLAWQARDDLQLNLNAQYNGRQHDQFFPPWPEPSRIVGMDDYTLLNLNATWQMSAALEVYARAENLLDEDYEEIYGFRAPGAGAYLGLRYQLQN